MKKRTLLSLLYVASTSLAWACPVCERQQPKILRGIIHGSIPQSQWDYLIVALIAIITVATLFYSIKWLLKPGEKSKRHIKRTILDLDDHD